MKIIYVQKIKLDVDTCRTSRLEITKNLINLGHNVTLIASYMKNKPDFNLGDRIKYIPSLHIPLLEQLTYTLFMYVKIIYILFREKPDAVIFDLYTCFCAFPVDILSRIGIVKTKFIVDVRSGIFHRRQSRLVDVLRRLHLKIALLYSKRVASGFTVISQLMKRKIVKEFGFSEDRFGIWSSGVSMEKFSAESVTVERIENLDGKFTIMYHGALGTDRGLAETVEAMKLLKPKYSDIIFFILGNGEEEGHLKNLVEQYKLDNVIFKDSVAQNQVPGYIKMCDLGIMPFDNTEVMRSSSPLKLMEYLAMEKPFIATDMEAFRQVVGTSKCGIFLDSNNPEDIAKGIELACKNRDNLKFWGKMGREIVERDYTWMHQARKLQNFLYFITQY